LVGELAGRNVDGAADARASCLDAGQGDGFHENFSLTRRNGTAKSKTTSRVCGWWPGYCCITKLVGQASFPARRLGPLIRMAGRDVAPSMSVQGFELAQTVCMTLKEVEQRGNAGVKGAGCGNKDYRAIANSQEEKRQPIIRRSHGVWRRNRVRAGAGPGERGRGRRVRGPRCLCGRGRRRGGRRRGRG